MFLKYKGAIKSTQVFEAHNQLCMNVDGKNLKSNTKSVCVTLALTVKFLWTVCAVAKQSPEPAVKYASVQAMLAGACAVAASWLRRGTHGGSNGPRTIAVLRFK